MILLNSFMRRIAHYHALSGQDVSLLSDLCRRTRTYEAREDVIREGDDPSMLNIFLSGWACRYKMLEDGRRQIIALLLPGDFCDLHNVLLHEMDHSICALTPITVAQPREPEVRATMLQSEPIRDALWWHSLTVVAMKREWTMNIGQRSAQERIGSLLCEIYLRLHTVGLTDGDECDFPLTQSDLAEATGLTAVHVNRTLQEMRSAGLIQLRSRRLVIPDFDRLAKAALFNANYLHLMPAKLPRLPARILATPDQQPGIHEASVGRLDQT